MKAKDDAREDAAADETERSSELLRGRQQVIAVLVTIGGSFVTVALLGAPVANVVGPLFALLLLGVQLFRGRPWARWALIAMIVVFAAGNAYMAIGSFAGGGAGWVINTGLGLIYLWCAFVLAFSSAVQVFMSAQRSVSGRPR